MALPPVPHQDRRLAPGRLPGRRARARLHPAVRPPRQPAHQRGSQPRSPTSWRSPPTPSRRKPSRRRSSTSPTPRRTTPTSTGSARTSRRAAGRWPRPNPRTSGTLRAHNQGSSRPSRVKVPVGPPFGKVTAHTTLAAPWATCGPPAARAAVRSASEPGQTALTRMPSRYSSPASSPGQRVERRLGDAVGRAAAVHQRDRAALARHVHDAGPRRPAQQRQQRLRSPATRRTG